MKELNLKLNEVERITHKENLDKLDKMPPLYYEIKDDVLKLRINNKETTLKLIYDGEWAWKFKGNKIYTNNFSFIDKVNGDMWNNTIYKLLYQAFHNQPKVKIIDVESNELEEDNYEL